MTPEVDDISDDACTDTLVAPLEKPPEETTAKRVRRIIFRIVFTLAALAFSFWILAATFDDLDFDSIVDAVSSLQDADDLSLFAMWLLWIASQGLLTASLVPGMPVRRGVIAYLGPAAVAFLIPGPSDLPVRYRILTSWGYSTGEATLAVAAGGIFSIGIKLVLPVVAAIGLLAFGSAISGAMQTVVIVCLLVGVGVAAAALVLGSEKRTAWAGRVFSPIWSRLMRLLRKPQPDDLAAQLVAARAEALSILHDRWLVALWGTVLTAATRFALLLMALRFAGLSAAVVPWPQVFVVFALVAGLTVLPITPGEAGISEIAYIGLLTAAAGDQYVNVITAGVLIFRVLTWLLVIPVGLGALGFWKIELGRQNSAQEPDHAATALQGTPANQAGSRTADRSLTDPREPERTGCQ